MHKILIEHIQNYKKDQTTKQNKKQYICNINQNKKSKEPYSVKHIFLLNEKISANPQREQ